MVSVMIAQATHTDIQSFEAFKHLLTLESEWQVGRREQIAREQDQLLFTAMLLESSGESCHSGINVIILIFGIWTFLNLVYIIKV